MKKEKLPIELFTVKEVCKMFKCGKTKIYNLLNEGKIEAIEMDGQTRITLQGVMNYIEKQPKWEGSATWHK
jgi:excisionase family DNA binding protein